MDKTRLESVVADALRLAKQMMRDSWSSGEVASWAPGYEALKSHLREEIAVCIERAIAAERESCSAEFVENGRAIGRADGIAAEREACAKHAENQHPDDWAFIGCAIRNRAP